MASEIASTKPYMVRAIHEWCIDNALTPHLLVAVNQKTIVPQAFVKNGEIVLNLNYSATKDLRIKNDAITFSARFSGVAQNLYVPMDAVRGIFARENGQGMFFEVGSQNTLFEPDAKDKGGDGNNMPANSKEKKKPTLKIVK
ncbi:MAG TPA: ClpXP protease specificity-enhancing factor [Methylophilaceae bacterium]|nr:ClpXP protease specificity-enhancing factor [Methylophilaceae bacterium]